MDIKITSEDFKKIDDETLEQTINLAPRVAEVKKSEVQKALENAKAQVVKFEELLKKFGK